MRILTFSTLFPNREMPHHGIFVAERLRHVLETGAVDAAVLAPIPWFPLTGEGFGQYGAFARVSPEESFEGCVVDHPRYPLIPKLGMSSAPLFLALASLLAIRRRFGDLEDFDLIDAHYFYPDGVAAVLLGHWLNKPVVITGRGTDLNLIPQYRIPLKWIRWASERANRMVTVSDALAHRLVELGAPADRVRTLRNGVDLERFRPLERDSLRRRLGFSGRTLLSVGLLIERKGHHHVIESLRALKDCNLVIVGTGPEEGELRRLSEQREVSDRVTFTGGLDHQTLAEYYNAADCLVLCSSREGMPNVVLESLACGTPVAGTAVWGTPEVLNAPEAGVLIHEQSAAGVVKAVRRLLSAYPDRADTRRHAEKFNWDATTAGQLDVFSQAIAEGRR
ncbi:glycosyltransferase [Lentisalinibacter salinarum]|uniref:glycosyltransferase n=1 Tax=Lentisalinibacter salinarum TaxID=2992239 RepID=UPI00386E3BE2